ncbi:winged helix-turn-helix domain-containing protein [Streptomyces sp. ITFR-16]|uniref:ArsR/SmtB family transcription factor n=1 Tax=Streptomyces sp. ITFR-16 TaxID=3075198 RepID=UPI002889DBB4|nr:winged helix-turn-helix domain-containing protein [Streptomyces sp. ITFR-16]WNI21074.1 winged helix-turn-helix domain-containing protein [Streptomyces sp. ITFR-16]
MLRVHFTSEDLARVRVAPGPDFLWEISNSVQTLQRRDGERVFGTWRRWVRPRLSAGPRLLSSLLPPHGYSPDFLTPTCGDRATLQASVDTLLSTPRPRLRTELTQLASSLQLPSWVRSLAGGDAETLRQLGGALRTYQREALAPYWRRVHADVEADRAVRLHSLLDGGTEGLLTGLGPQFRWRAPVLEVTYPVEQDLHLRGRGLVLQPSFFCWPTPITLADGDLPPVLVHPIQHTPDWAGPARPAEDAGPLGPLLGHTRAGILRATRTGCSTVEAARLLDVTHPAVSQHLNVLRAAGLVTTVRRAGRSLHVATAEGRALLAAEERAHGRPSPSV